MKISASVDTAVSTANRCRQVSKAAARVALMTRWEKVRETPRRSGRLPSGMSVSP
jgi:hypothetical protein